MMEVENSWRRAASHYVGGPYAGTVTLLQTKQRALRVRLAYAQDPNLGWGAFLREGNLRRAPVPGDHLRMLHGENVQAVAAVVEERIRALVAGPAPNAPKSNRSPSAVK